MKKIVAVVLMAAMVFAGGMVLKAVASDDKASVLHDAKEEILDKLLDIDHDLLDATKELSTIDLKSKKARDILANVCEYRPYAIDCGIIDLNGKLIVIEPPARAKYEGEDVITQAQLKEVLSAKKTVLSKVFHSVEGEDAVDFEYPIINKKGELLGIVSLLVNHSAFLGGIAAPIVEGKPYSIWVMQTDGTIIYDPDPIQVNKNLFTDPMYADFASVISFAKQAAGAQNGANSYDFYKKGLTDKTVVKKAAVWDTVSLYGTDWRIIVTQIVENKPAPKASAKQ